MLFSILAAVELTEYSNCTEQSIINARCVEGSCVMDTKQFTYAIDKIVAYLNY